MKRFAPLALLALSTVAPAAGLGNAASYNGFFSGDVNTGGGHADGAVAVGGNWNGSYYEVNQHTLQATAPVANVGLYLGGSNQTSNFLRVLRGDSHVGGSYGSNLDTQQGTKDHNVSASFFTDQYAYSRSQSSAIRQEAIAQNRWLSTAGNNLNLNLGTLAGTNQYYRVNGSDLTGGKTLDFTGWNGTDTIVFDVVGDVADWGWSVNLNGGLANNVLWNFHDAAVVNVTSRQFTGSMLAPDATINQYQNLNGNVIAYGWNQYNGSEIHFGSQWQFTGDPVPEPASMAALGLGALALMRRRRER